ncbi:hypothetical protein EAO75_28075 [Streptomyces sp. uw30]|uniref:hypothetical protein n=1 Tax=Streptomyces sp. uw30 TaxID=1828179 RepID=UPI0011CE59D5|nr:hypothetical protein [Streptomyces sp. uw30]TXS46544.1 hypothetical protein EAO75_28075 [Streptomyces sp. uw30]
MSEEFAPQQSGGSGSGQPKGLLQQMEELMAALNADLSALDADLQSTGGPGRGEGRALRLRPSQRSPSGAVTGLG